MLARTPKAADMDFASILKIPPMPAAIAEAERKWQAAVADRETAQAKHREMHRLWHNQVPGMPPKITAAEVDQAGAEIAPFLEREKEALQTLEAQRAAFDAEVASLKPKIEAYRAAIAVKIDELEDFISIGAAFYASSVQAKVKLPSRMPSRCEGLLSVHGVGMLRRLLNAVD
ncbi:MAG: hypothetical protein EOS65_10930 [Mesorhizobium sp.]|uniref:hypothetical protein n=1 Tax=Mesorhizobium sp. TaxID=1871066 RepID=UPI000FEA1339|nr:hypothetical protein [Mesorhizobium sp.]RWF41849.1 MAG: hypothetical protein EOS65_10930 [Mesorhizobium sp.]